VSNPPSEETDWPRTHRVAVGAYIFRGDRLLLVKRRNPPFTFAPPGGRLLVDEDPIAGLRREVREETNLEIELAGLAHHWYGSMDGQRPELLCMNFLAESTSGDVWLSEEHSDFVWVSRADIAGARVSTLDENDCGYQPRDILRAFDLYAARRGGES